MIKRLRYHEIDFDKYDECLENSVQKNFYAKRENLDFLCEKWEILVVGNYEAVMPLPIKKKFGFEFVLMPLFCQQLGIFSREDDQKTNDLFLQFLEKKFKVFYYALNHQNKFSSTLNVRKNYFLKSTNYSLLRKNYFKGRKSAVKASQKLIFKEITLTENTLDFIAKHFRGLEKVSDQNKFLDYIQYLNQNKFLKMFGAFKEDVLANIAIFIDSETQYSLLGLINNDHFKKENGASFIVDAVLKRYISEKSIDFMGGSIRGIEVFFKSFGSELQEYPVIQSSKVQLIKKLFKNR